MKRRIQWLVVAATLVAMMILGNAGVAAEVSPAEAGENVSWQGQWVRLAYNDDGWVVLGYRTANDQPSAPD